MKLNSIKMIIIIFIIIFTKIKRTNFNTNNTMPTKDDSLSLKKAILEWSRTTKLPIITKIIDSKSNTIIKYAYSLIFVILSGIK